MEALHFSGVNARRFGIGGFFLEADDAPVLVGFENAEFAGGRGGIHFDGGDGDVRSRGNVLLQHLLVIHFVNVVAGENEDVVRLLAADRIDILVHGVGSALIPVLRDAHLRRQNFDKVAVAHQRGPAATHVAIEAQRLVLREDKERRRSLFRQLESVRSMMR